MVRRGVLRDVEEAADLPVRAATGELGEDLHLARGEAVGRRLLRVVEGAELRGAGDECRQPDRPTQTAGESEVAADQVLVPGRPRASSMRAYQ